MTPLPLPKQFYIRALELNIGEIHLNFSGGSDEAYYQARLFEANDESQKLTSPDQDTEDERKRAFHKLEEDITNWMADSYGYSGAGDGSDYGDDIVYDLVNKTVETSEWYTARVDGETSEHSWKVE